MFFFFSHPFVSLALSRLPLNLPFSFFSSHRPFLRHFPNRSILPIFPTYHFYHPTSHPRLFLSSAFFLPFPLHVFNLFFLFSPELCHACGLLTLRPHRSHTSDHVSPPTRERRAFHIVFFLWIPGSRSLFFIFSWFLVRIPNSTYFPKTGFWWRLDPI